MSLFDPRWQKFRWSDAKGDYVPVDNPRITFNSLRVITPNGKTRRVTVKQARAMAVKYLGMSRAQADASDFMSLMQRMHDAEVFTLHAHRGGQYTRPGQALSQNPRGRRRARAVRDPEHRKILKNLQGHFAKDERAAKQLWREFREEPVGRSRRINIRWPKALAVMGSAQLIAYATTHGGKLRLYEHEFAPGSQPLLCAGKEPGQLFLIGQGFKVDAHGIVDIDRHGRRKRHTPRLKVVRRR